MKDSYKYSLDAAVIIIDEFDDLLHSYPYDIQQSEVKGLWCFTGKKVIGLTAALSEGHINIARLAMMSKGEEPTLLEFPSSYSFYTN